MYAQYQSYQQPNAAASNQQQTWNGSAWVTAPHPAQSSTHSTYEQPQKTSVLPPNPVTTYTEYYHGWTAHGKECQANLRRLGPANTHERQEAQRMVDWAKYYADESSRAAHFFYQNPNATSAPFDLPPAPPKPSTPVAPPAPAPAANTTVPSSLSPATNRRPLLHMFFVLIILKVGTFIFVLCW